MTIFKKKPPETPPERPAKKKAAEPVAHAASPSVDDAPTKPIHIGPQGRACRVDGFIHAEAACPVCGTIEGNS